uniref:Uncharacterized protein n=1 Tax=Glossina brevipalpis TaxID=37001 RepID=A0A1A9WQW9_9MUSC
MDVVADSGQHCQTLNCEMMLEVYLRTGQLVKKHYQRLVYDSIYGMNMSAMFYSTRRQVTNFVFTFLLIKILKAFARCLIIDILINSSFTLKQCVKNVLPNLFLVTTTNNRSHGQCTAAGSWSVLASSKSNVDYS